MAPRDDAAGISPRLFATLAADVGLLEAAPAVGSDGERGPYTVQQYAMAAVAGTLRSAAHYAGATSAAPAAVELDPRHVAVAVRSERFARDAQGERPPGFAPLSRFWPAADGFIRTHANYPWHRAALLRVLGLPEATHEAADVVGARLAAMRAADAEREIVLGGGVAAAVRTPEQWAATAQAHVNARRPLIDIEAVGDAPARPRRPGPLPASGLRVLDLTRVIAGPVATRMLAALGATVLRLDPPHRPELPLHRLDGLPGKYSAVLDAADAAGRRVLHGLLDEADVVVCGYRPGSLDRLGLHPQALAVTHPGIVVANLGAWGSAGPWADRRGFDSLVQAASGIATVFSADGQTPGALPCQLLDHASGYLLAAGVFAALDRQRRTGGTIGCWVALARTAQWVLEHGIVSDGDQLDAAEAAPFLEVSAQGVTAVRPPGSIAGVALAYPPAGAGYGCDPAVWPQFS